MKELAELTMRLAELERRVSHAHRHGTVHEVDASKGLMRLRIGGTQGEPLLGPWIPYAQVAGALKVHAPPSVGQQFTMISPAGDYRQAIALPMTWSDQNASPSQSGSENVLTYGPYKLTLDAGKLLIERGGITFKIDGDGVSIEADVKIQGDVEIEGDLKASGGTFEHNAIFVGDDHVHTKVEPGGSLSGPPP